MFRFSRYVYVPLDSGAKHAGLPGNVLPVTDGTGHIEVLVEDS